LFDEMVHLPAGAIRGMARLRGKLLAIIQPKKRPLK
jgi:hypothetical protein